MAVSETFVREVAHLRARLAEAQDALEAIRTGAADALVGEAGDILQLPGSSKPYIAFFDTMNEGGVTLDSKGAILHANPCFVSMSGRPMEDLRNAPFLSCVVPGDRAHVMEMLEADGAVAREVSLATRNDSLPVRLSIKSVAAGGEIFRCAVVTDLSERAAADAELRIAAIAFESQESIAVTDVNSVIVRVNHAFTNLTGFSAEEAVGKKPNILRSGRQDPDFYRKMWDKLLATKFWQGEIWNRHKDGRIYAHWLTISAVCAPDGAVTHYVGVLSEITKNKEAEAEIHRLAYYDPLTGLPNRRLLLDRLRQAVAGTSRSGRYGAAMFLDLDNFKTLNDTRGHDVGDQLLREVSQRLRASVRESDTVARLGGDEFLLLLEDLGTDTVAAGMQARQVGEKVREALAMPYQISEHKTLVSVSIGISMFRGHEVSVADLLKHADLALYKAKDCGRNTLQFFDPTMQSNLDERVALEADLREAIDRRELFLHYQPQVDDNRRVIGAEVLLRWTHPVRGLIPPKDFIPLAEQFGLIVPLGKWLLQSVCDQLNTWSGDSLTRDLIIAVNVSQHQFRQASFVEEVRNVLKETGANPALLKIELTESMLIEDINGAMAKMRELKAIGTGISIDDFGTGYSSLCYLTQLPIEQLKIDASFVANLPHDARDAVITQTIIDMARNLSLNVIAEGVESEEQLGFLMRHGCHAFQGFLFSHPLPIMDFERLLRNWGERGVASIAVDHR